MCGIAGIITNNKYQDTLGDLAGKMQNALRHRGPDDQGMFVSQSRQAALAHTRLSIIDLSSAGHQPMPSQDKRFWITFNGEIYNFRALRLELEKKGEIFQSFSDTEIILKLYQREGIDCLHKIRGMFAFAIWDEIEKSCFLVRDPFGIKPLYYFSDGNILIFASELRALLSTQIPKKQLSKEGLYGYFLSGSVPEPYTMIERIFSLQAGRWMRWQNGKLESPKRYWKIEFKPEKTTFVEACQKVRNSLINSIENHFVSDVPLGVFLSGGIDSSSLVALARKTQKGNLFTYTVTFEESGWNEGPIARKVAEKFNTNHTEYLITAQEARKMFDSFLDNVDQPTIDGFNTYCISKIAKENGAKVLLSGLGSDELFGGYQSFRKIPRMIYWGHVLCFLHLANVLSSALGKRDKPYLRRIADFLHKDHSAMDAYRSLRGIFSETEAELLMPQYISDFTPSFPFVDIPSNVHSLKDEISYLELSYYMRNQLLRDSDVMSMAHGVEIRVPFVDRVFFEDLSSIPSNMRILPNKKLLVNSVPELPKETYNRPKQGFLLPFQDWIRKDWERDLLEVEVPKGVTVDLWYRRWSLFVLNRWWQKVSA